MKILRNLCLHFAKQDGQENHTTKVTKIPKTKRQKFGMNETLLNFREAFERPFWPYVFWHDKSNFKFLLVNTTYLNGA